MIDVSIVIPVLNEEKFIIEIYKALLINDQSRKEIIFCDAGSVDNSLKIISDLVEKDSRVILLMNKQKNVSSAFNDAFKIAKGNHIALLGAHTIYPPNYIETALYYLDNADCDVVGGPIEHIGNTYFSSAIAYCMSCVFGVGDTRFRTSTKREYVSTVPFPVYKKAVFEKAGLFSADLVKNQDDDFHYRLNELGFKILMVPELKSKYFVRNKLTPFIKQYFYYGFYKPLVLIRNKKSIKLRHIIPSVFAIYLLTLIITAFLPFESFIKLTAFFPLMVYFTINIYFSFKNSNPFSIKIISIFIFFLIHLSYGIGFISGIYKMI